MNSIATLRHASPADMRTTLLTAVIVSFPNIVCLPYEWACLCGTECRILIVAYFIFRLLLFASATYAQTTLGKRLRASSPSRILAVNSGISATAYLLALPVSVAVSKYIPTDARGSILVFQFMVIAIICSSKTFIDAYKSALKQKDGKAEQAPGVAEIPKPSHLLISTGDRILPVQTDSIAFIYASNRRASVTTLDGKTYQYGQSLDQTMSVLREDSFFRVNKQYIISKKAVAEITVWFDNRLLIKLPGIETPEPVYVSKNKASQFKKWMAQ